MHPNGPVSHMAVKIARAFADSAVCSFYWLQQQSKKCKHMKWMWTLPMW